MVIGLPYLVYYNIVSERWIWNISLFYFNNSSCKIRIVKSICS